MIPTRNPSMWEKPHFKVSPYPLLNSSNLDSETQPGNHSEQGMNIESKPNQNFHDESSDLDEEV